jgi:hypothetical protein
MVLGQMDDQPIMPMNMAGFGMGAGFNPAGAEPNFQGQNVASLLNPSGLKTGNL